MDMGSRADFSASRSKCHDVSDNSSAETTDARLLFFFFLWHFKLNIFFTVPNCINIGISVEQISLLMQRIYFEHFNYVIELRSFCVIEPFVVPIKPH